MRAYGRLSFNQKITVWLTFSSNLVAVVSLGVAFRTFQISADTTETQKAIANLSTLAAQSRRQADATTRQLDEMQRQTSSLALQAQAAQGQLDAAKAQSAAISEQTTAIKDSSVAAIRSADAQARSAMVSERGQLPNLALEGLSISGLLDGPDVKAPVELQIHMSWTNTGGGQLTHKRSIMGIWIGSDLPETPPTDRIWPWGGNELVLPAGRSLTPVKPLVFDITQEQNRALVAGQMSVFVFGAIPYEDRLGASHIFCFAYRLKYRDGNLQDPFPAGGPKYHCLGDTPIKGLLPK